PLRARDRQARRRLRIACHRLRRRAQRTFRGIEIFDATEQVAEPRERLRRDAVARRHGIIAEGARAVDERLVVVCREVEAAALPILEALYETAREVICERE